MKLSRNAVIAEIEDESGQKFSVATRVERIERLGIGVDSYGPIAFTRGALSSWQNSRGIWTMQPDGSGLKKLELVNEITGIPDHAAWSPDGTRIAFGVRQGEADKKQWSLWVQELATASAIQAASFGPGEGPIWQPAWSPDGTQIAFEHGAVFQNGEPVDPRTNREIFVVGVDGSAESIQLTDTLEDSNHPTWSPDGSRIAFARSADKNQGIPYMIMLMNPDGTDGEFVTLGSDPSWSPDGKSIAFA